MAQSYECFSCKKVFLGVAEKKCPSCGSTDGQLLSKERLEEGVKGGIFYDIDPSTGKRAKKRRGR